MKNVFACNSTGTFEHPTNKYAYYYCSTPGKNGVIIKCESFHQYDPISKGCTLVPTVTPTVAPRLTEIVSTSLTSLAHPSSSMTITPTSTVSGLAMNTPVPAKYCQSNKITCHLDEFKKNLTGNTDYTHVSSGLKNIIDFVSHEFDEIHSSNPINTVGINMARDLDMFLEEVTSQLGNETMDIDVLGTNIALQVATTTEDVQFPDYSNPLLSAKSPWNRLSDCIFIPQNFTEGLHRVISLLYLNLHEMVPAKLSGSSRVFSMNSRIISSSIFPPLTSSPDDNITIMLENMKIPNNVSELKCVFWDYNLSDGTENGSWSDVGCTLLTDQSTETHTVCTCNHLTSFAVLLHTKHTQLSENHRFALHVITYIGCSLSLFGALLTVFGYVVFTGINSERSIIHINLVTSLGIAQLIFLVGIQSTKERATCMMVALFLHYFYLAAFAWMLCEGLHLHSMVVKVFNISSRMHYYLAFSWGLPAFIVGISAGFRHEYYGSTISCWLSPDKGTIFAFIVPVAMILTVNVCVLVNVMREISKLQQLSTRRHKLRFIRTSFKAAVVLFPLLGVTWLLGILLFITEEVAFQYLFSITNSLQGFFIFMFHCLLNSEMMRSFHRKKVIWQTSNARIIRPTRSSSQIAPVNTPDRQAWSTKTSPDSRTYSSKSTRSSIQRILKININQ